MFDHVTVRFFDREAAERFYDTVLPTPGPGQARWDEHVAEWGD